MTIAYAVSMRDRTTFVSLDINDYRCIIVLNAMMGISKLDWIAYREPVVAANRCKQRC